MLVEDGIDTTSLLLRGTSLSRADDDDENDDLFCLITRCERRSARTDRATTSAMSDRKNIRTTLLVLPLIFLLLCWEAGRGLRRRTGPEVDAVVLIMVDAGFHLSSPPDLIIIIFGVQKNGAR